MIEIDLDKISKNELATILIDKDKEIERLNNIIKGLDNTIENLEEVIKHKDSIIKEVREYIEERYNGEVLTHTFDKDNVGELLEILKGSDKE